VIGTTLKRMNTQPFSTSAPHSQGTPRRVRSTDRRQAGLAAPTQRGSDTRADSGCGHPLRRLRGSPLRCSSSDGSRPILLPASSRGLSGAFPAARRGGPGAGTDRVEASPGPAQALGVRRNESPGRRQNWLLLGSARRVE